MARPAPRPPIGPPKPRIPNLMMRVWDAPTRLFHWAVVALILTSYFSMKYNKIELHFLAGYTMLALLLFRLVWGLIGSDTARFRAFLRSPAEALRHLAHFPRREPDTEIGHNAAGGWMVIAMLLVLAFQVGTGLFANDDVDQQGPLRHFVSKETSDWLTGLHGKNFYDVLLVLIGLHILAVLAYAAVKRHDLVRPMITGRKRLPATMRQPRFTSPAFAALVLAVVAGLVWAMVRFI